MNKRRIVKFTGLQSKRPAAPFPFAPPDGPGGVRPRVSGTGNGSDNKEGFRTIRFLMCQMNTVNKATYGLRAKEHVSWLIQ